MCVCVCVCVWERESGGRSSTELRNESVFDHLANTHSNWPIVGSFRGWNESFGGKKKDEKTKIGVNYVLILSGTFYLQKFLFHYMSRIFCSYFSNPNKSNMCSVNALWAAYLYMQVWSLALTCKSLWWNSSILTTLKRDGLTMDWAAVWHLVWESVGTMYCIAPWWEAVH